MLNEFPALSMRPLMQGTSIQQPLQWPPERVRLANPAIYVMTDFQRVRPVVTEPHRTVEEASQRMILHRVRMLLVLDEAQSVVGLVTATDILGGRANDVAAARGIGSSELLVRDVMTPREKLEVLQLQDVLAANVGQIVATLKKSHRLHAIVVETVESEDSPGNFGANVAGPEQMVRGVFSTSQIARQLGADIRTTDVSRTYEELEAFLQ